MRAKHLFACFVLTVVLLLATVTPALAEFTDVGESPYKKAINNLAAWEIVGGYKDGLFGPDDHLLRAQFAKMAVLTMEYAVSEADTSTFLDTPAVDPANPLYPGAYAAVAAANNIVKGYESGNFGFWDNLTRQQLITVTVRAAGDVLAPPPDGYQGQLNYSDPTHGANIKRAEYNGLLDGIANLATWDTTQEATRGETAELLHALFTMTLRLVGPGGTERLSIADVMGMESSEGFGGYRNSLGNVTGPLRFKGVSLADLMALVGGGNTVTFHASDGYRKTFNAAETAGTVAQLDPVSGEELKDRDPLTLILAYQVGDAALAYGDGPLRTALVSAAADQVTASKLWIKQIVKIVVE